jgi:hypothetical protein
MSATDRFWHRSASLPRWVADTGQGGVLSINAQLKQDELTWRAADPDRQALTGAALFPHPQQARTGGVSNLIEFGNEFGMRLSPVDRR